jgi:sodium bicarbonate transporter 10
MYYNFVYFLAEMLVDNMVANDKINFMEKDKVLDILLTRHRHQHDKKHHHDHKGLPFVRSLADIGKKNSEKRLEGKGL